MAIIKNIAFFNRFKLKKNSTFGDFLGAKIYFPPPIIDFLHYFLPIKLKFLPEYFVAVENSKLLGLIGLQTTKGNSRKIRITNFFLEQNSYDVGEQLINFAMLKLAARGAHSFFVNLDENLSEMQSLFLQSCNFRVCAKESVFSVDTGRNSGSNSGSSANFAMFRLFKIPKTKQLCQLYNDSINAHQKYYFTRSLSEFKREFTNVVLGKTSFKYVLENEEKNEIYGFVSISTHDNFNYVLECFLSQPFSSYFQDVIAFAKMQIAKRNKKYNLYLKLKNCYNNSRELLDFALKNETGEFKHIQTNVILTKDFLNVVKENNLVIENARIIFGDFTQAYKS